MAQPDIDRGTDRHFQSLPNRLAPSGTSDDASGMRTRSLYMAAHHNLVN